MWRRIGRHSHNVHAQVPSYGAPWFQLLSCCCPLLASDHMLCSCTVHLPLSRGTIPASQPSLPRVRDWSVVLTSTEPRLIACHYSVIASHPPDTPGRAPVLESLTQILCDGASLVAAPRSADARVCPRRRQPRRWNEDCFHTYGSWRDFRRSGSEADHSRFCIMRQRFRRIVRHSRSVNWDDWLCRVQSLSHRDPRIAAAHIRRTFRSTAASPDLCNMQWPVADHRSVLSQRDSVAQWRAHFASAATSSEFSRDFFTSTSRRFTSLTSPRFDAPFSYREPAAALSKCHESVPGADLLPFSVFKVHFPWWRHVLLSFLNIILQWAVVPSSWKSSTRLLLANISLLLCVQGVRAPDLRPHRTPYFRTIGECQGGFRWGAGVMTYSLLDTPSQTSRKPLTPRGWRLPWCVCTPLAHLDACGI